jgi:hypothetical protein
VLVWQRKEVQKMLRGVNLFGFLIASASLYGGIFPDQIGQFRKGPVKTITVPDQALFEEYGLDATEQAEYAAGAKHFSATAWRLHDSTGAMALYESKRPPGAIPSEIGKLGVRTSDGVIFAHGNYVFRLTGNVPAPAEMEPVYKVLPKLDGSPLPALMTYLPPEGLIANSERYILGPVSLDRFDPKIPPSVAAFELGTEGQLGTYRTAKGPLTMAIFKYPSPSFARERVEDFQKIPGASARRVGALVAVTVDPPDPDEAQRVLSQVHYDTDITLSEKVSSNDVKQKVSYILDVFVFSGMLILGCLVAGIAFGGFRTIRRKLRNGPDPEALTTLHL